MLGMWESLFALQEILSDKEQPTSPGALMA